MIMPIILENIANALAMISAIHKFDIRELNLILDTKQND